MLEALADAEREGTTTLSKTGRIPGDHFSTEYGFHGQVGGPRIPEESQPEKRPTAPNSTDSKPVGEESYRVDIRELDDGLLVVADMPDVDVEDITAGIDEERDKLVVGVGRDSIERIPLPWAVEDVQATFHHGILELRITSKESEQ